MIGSLPALRGAVDRLLTDTGRIERQDGYTTDPDGFEVPNYVTIHEGPLLVRPESVQVATVGGVEFPLQRFDVTLPAGTEPRIGDRVVVADSADPMLVNANLNLTDVALDSWQLARYCKATRS